MDRHGVTAPFDRDNTGPDGSQMSKVLFVCTGNICRSAFAEACLKSLLADGACVRVSSAGTAAMVGYGMDPMMAHEAEMRGIVAGGHRARQLTGRILGDSDIVLVFGSVHAEWIEREYPEHLAKVVGLGEAARVLRQRPPRAVTSWHTLADDVRALSSGLQAEDEIADPYRRGLTAAEHATERICRDINALCCGLVERA